jgi:hypothetical protein
MLVREMNRNLEEDYVRALRCIVRDIIGVDRLRAWRDLVMPIPHSMNTHLNDLQLLGLQRSTLLDIVLAGAHAGRWREEGE